MANRIAGITVTINGDTTALSKSLESCYRNTCDIYIPPNNHYNQRSCLRRTQKKDICIFTIVITGKQKNNLN